MLRMAPTTVRPLARLASSSSSARTASATSGLKTTSAFPLIDVSLWSGDGSAASLDVERQWHDAFSTYGFCNIIGHGIDLDAQDALHRSALSYFRQPLSVKMRDCLNKGYGSGGYVPQGVEAVARSVVPGIGSQGKGASSTQAQCFWVGGACCAIPGTVSLGSGGVLCDPIYTTL